MASVQTKFKNIQPEVIPSLKKAHGLLLVSVGQEAHEDARFDSTIQLINRSFGSCSIALYDSLQRHTM
ncbi:MAG: hypothetical protein ACK4PR_07100, partial [Gammaproteobacteria bacterium]